MRQQIAPIIGWMLACYKGICFIVYITQIYGDYFCSLRFPIKRAILVLWDSGSFILYSFSKFPYNWCEQEENKEERLDVDYSCFISGEHHELKNNQERNGSGRQMPLWGCMLCLHAMTGEGNFRQTNKLFFLTPC